MLDRTPGTAMVVRSGFAITAFSHQGRGYYLVIITVSMMVGWWYHPAAPILHLFHGSGMNPRSWLCGWEKDTHMRVDIV